MSDDSNPENVREQLAAVMAALKNSAAAAPPPGGWGQPSPAPTATGVSVPVAVQTPMGKVRVQLHYGAEHATPDGVMLLVQQLAQSGMPVDAWMPKTQGGGWGGGNRGGWGGGNRGGGNW